MKIMSGQIKKARLPNELGPSAKNTNLFYYGLWKGAMGNGKFKNKAHGQTNKRVYLVVLPRERIPGLQKGTTKEAKEHPNRR